MRKEFNFTIGADPEFNLILQGKRIMAKNSIEVLMKGKKDVSPSPNGGYEYKEFGEIGWDGAHATGEVRPKFAKTADAIAQNLKELFGKLHEYAPLFEISTLSYFASVGGHMHFGLPSVYNTEAKIAGFHKKLASFYLPLMLSESKINLQLRNRSSYGQLTDFRTANRESGGSRALVYEFRAPSAEWITTEKIALSTLAYMGTVANEIINHPKKMAALSGIYYHTQEQARALQSLALTEYKIVTQALFNEIKKNIKTFEFYPTYKKEIDYILNPLRVIADKKKAHYNIVHGWGFKDVCNLPSRKDLVNSKKMEVIMKERNIDLDTSKAFIDISYNNDTNVENFSNALSQRVAVYNWRLKNTYFLFGVRKGIEKYIVWDDEENIYTGSDMIKTTGDKDSISTLYRRMMNKYQEATRSQKTTSSAAAILKDLEADTEGKLYLIGIPYDERVKLNVNPFLELVHSLESNAMKGHALATAHAKDIVDDSAIEFSKKGSIFQVYNKPETETELAFDEGSGGLQNAINAAEELVQEMERTERRESEEDVENTQTPEGSFEVDDEDFEEESDDN